MSTMIRYKTILYKCQCCDSPGKGKIRAQEKEAVRKEIEEELDE